MSIEALDDWPGTDDKDRLREWLALTYAFLGARELYGMAVRMDYEDEPLGIVIIPRLEPGQNDKN